MKISIALCTFNGSRYIKEELDSIITQSRLPDELVICDDCSKDNTIDIIKEFSPPFPLSLYVNEFNMGVIKNFEKAISICKGDIIVLSDQDDVWHPQKLEKIEKAFLNFPDMGAMLTDADVVDERLNSIGYTLWQSIRFSNGERKLVKSGNAFKLLLKHNVATGATMAFRSSYKKLILPIPSVYMHDAWIALIIAAFSHMGLIEEPMIKYRQHEDQQLGATEDILYAGARKQLIELILHPANYSRWRRPNYEAELENERRLYWALNDRLTGLDVNENKYNELRNKLGHIEARASILKKRRIQRLPDMLKELVTLRYDRYSNGFLFFLNDLLI
jgi:glycosyltransferase involved in cell wall biosynthesis